MFCFICHADIDFFPHLFIIQRTVSIRLDVTVLYCLIRFIRQIRFKGTVTWQIFFDCIPHFKKCDGERSDRISFQADAGIFPFSIGMRKTKVFICQIIAAGKSYFSINNSNLTMITVVQK